MSSTQDGPKLNQELNTFMQAYEQSSNSRNFDSVAPMIADDATYWFTDGTHEGIQAIRAAFEATYAKIREETYTISNVNWLLKSYEMAACTYNFRSEGVVDGQAQVYEGRGTSVLKKIDGNWRVVHEHLSKST